MAPGLPQEQLQRVRGRLVRDLKRGSRRLLFLLLLLVLLGLLGDLDASPLELIEERVGLERVELMSFDQLSKLGLPNRARAFSVLQQSLDVLVLEDRVDLDGHLLIGCCLWA